MSVTDRRLGVTGAAAIKVPCRVATVGNVTLSGLQTIDGVSLASGDRVLVLAQTNGVQNGIYTVDSGAWRRAVDFNGPRDCTEGTLVTVNDGLTGSGVYRLDTSDPVIGTSSLSFVGSGFDVERTVGATPPAGYVLAEAPGLEPRIVGPLCSPDTRMIRRLYDAGDGKISVETEEDHGLSSGSGLYVRANGIDGATHMMIRANNWTGGPLVDNGTLEPTTVANPKAVRLGGDSWSYTVTGARTLTLTGANSIWKLVSTDPDPTILPGGFIYKTQVDAWPAVKQLGAYIAGRPHSRIAFGAGIFWFLRNGGDLSGSSWTGAGNVEMPAFSIVEGVHPAVSIFARGDYFNSTPFRFFDSGTQVRNIGQFGNAPFQKLATHGWKATASTNLRTIFDLSYENVWNWSIPGYTLNTGHPGGKTRMSLVNVRGFFNTNDFADFKGAQNVNPEGAFANEARSLFTMGCGMGTVGRNTVLPVELGSNPIGITNGSADFTVQLTFKPYVGQKFLAGDTWPDVGNFSFAGKGFTVKARSGTGNKVATVSYDGTTLASASTGSYGGTGLTLRAPSLFRGKPNLDMRAENWRVDGLFTVDLFGYSSGPRVRGGDGDNGNGKGGHNSVINNVISLSLAASGDDTDGEAFRGLALIGHGVQVSNFYCHGNGKGVGVSLQSGADRGSVRGLVEYCATGASITGSNVTAAITTNANATRDILIDGDNGIETARVDNPFSITSGSTVVTVNWPNAPAGFLTGNTLRITGSEIIGGIVNVGGSWVVTKTATDTFTFDSLQTATETTTNGGGEGVILDALGTQEPTGVVIELQSTNCAGTVLDLKRTSGVTVRNSSWDGSGTMLSTTANTKGLRFTPENIGFPTRRTIRTANSGTITALTTYDAGALIIVPETASGFVVIPLPSAATVNDSWYVDILAENGTGSIGARPTAAGSDVINDGASATAAGGYITSSTDGAFIRIQRGGTGAYAWYCWGKVGTWA